MAVLAKIVTFLDRELRLGEIPDYPGALNGLQMDGKERITRVGAAVDASLPVVRKAVEAGVDLLIVHHGMFWSGARPVTGVVYEKFKVAMEAGLAIYSAHIPLDVHPVLGNNACLAGALGLEEVEPFFEWKGILLGMKGRFAGSRDDLAGKCEAVLGGKPHLCPGGAVEAGLVGVISGGCGERVEAIRDAGIDTFVTGEGPHWSYTAAEELKLNVLYGGHYLTETFGVHAVLGLLEREFGIEGLFLDHPTGM
ncbi:MAG: Nif3-like dinuclear metal center hexameric protein [Verrucomicrobiaceae bacterium]|nr:Nif3-like dinuclear metal center hexameric protein [Verrucomicrobiaceae bacterium]